MKINEATIRDSLAQNLEVLESGLVLIEVEFRLQNSLGTGGRIDILAKDTFGNRVIIELKRSDASAREALHELFKYSSLYREKEGLPFGSVRTILVSTEWSELRVPFAEYLRVSETQCEGFELNVDSNGDVVSAEKHTPVELASPVNSMRTHSIFFFADKPDFEPLTSTISDGFVSVGGTGSVTICFSYQGDNQNVIYKHALYFVPLTVDPTTWDKTTESVIEQYEHLADAPEEELCHSVEEEIGHLHLKGLDSVWDTFEVGYPEKLHSMLHVGWEVQCIERNGRVPSQSAADDTELVRMISGVEGQNAIYFFKISKPSLTVQWNEMQENSEYCLAGNPVWEPGFQAYLEEVETSGTDSTVGVSIYNPMNLPFALYQILMLGDPRYFPQLEVIGTRHDQKTTEILLGRIAWDGSTCPDSVDQVLSADKLEEFSLAAHMGCQAELDGELMNAHGFSYSLVIVDEHEDDLRQRHYNPLNNQFVVVDSEGPVTKGIVEFLEQNPEYAKSVAQRLGSTMAVI